ncbi:DUF748 domain-containing protein [Methyloglobulus sp.]|uniref:DUF748 domain-containing protein n=1 Tax=Methyloglobulus sp. TaxID=2518622 RepID=UPI0039899A9B
MKKLATWIYRASQQFRSKFNLGWRSPDSPPPGQIGDERSRQSGIMSTSQALNAAKESLNKEIQAILRPFDKFKTKNEQGQQVKVRPGLIEDLNQKYIKLPEPFARFLKPFIITVCLVAAYAVLGFYIVPAVLKSKIPSIIQEETGRKASVTNIEFNPFTLLASIQGFKIQEKDGQPFVGFDNFNVKINAFQSIKQLALVIDEITLNKLTIYLAKQKDGKFNFEDMAKPKKQEEPKEPDDDEIFPINIVKLSIKEGKLFWDDKHFNKPVSEELSPINLNVSDLSTEANTKAKLDFSLALKSGGELDWKATVGVNPIFSEGGIKLDKVQLQKVLALALSDAAAFDLQGHELFNVDYKVGFDKKDLKVTIKKSRFELRDFQFADKSASKTLLKTPTFAVETDCIATIANNNLDVVVNKAKLDSRDLQFSNHAPDPISVTIPNFIHETDITVSQSKDGLKVVANKAVIAIKNLLLNGLNKQMVEVKIPDLTFETAYQLDISQKTKHIHVNQGKFEFHDLHLAEKGENATLIKIPAFGLSDMEINLKNKEVKIALISSKDAEFQAWLNPDGSLNYQKLIPTQEGKKVEVTRPDYATAKTVDFKEDVKTAATVATAAAQPVLPEKDWLLNIATLELINYMVNFEDRSLKKPATMTAKPINLKVINITNKPEAKLPFQLDIGVNKTGSIKLKGEAIISPLAAKIDVNVKNIDLEKFQPYVEKFARLDVLDGKFNIAGQLVVQQPPEKPLGVKFKGNTGIADLLTRDQILNKDFVKWENLTFKDLDVDLLANRYSASTLLIEKPYAKVTIRKDKTVNFSDIMIADKSNPDKSAKPAKSVKAAHGKATQSNKPVFKLDKVKIVDGSSDFADLSLILPFAAQIKSLDGGAHGISSDQKATVKVDLKGNAYDLAPVDIKGEIRPYQGIYDIDLNFDGMPMPLVSPYMVQFAGYKIEKGKLTVGLKYQVKKGKLSAANNILIDQLELGEKVDNPDAVSLPLALAIALLKDSSGKIKLDVPLTGSLEDPQFSIGGIIVDALVNVLTKIVTSPFNALASLVGSEENLSVIGFAPGKEILDTKEMSKLDSVAKALKEKPVLNLEIKGAAFEGQDWPILREEALLNQLKKTKAAELSEEEGKKVRAEYVELSEDDYNDLLADAFIKKFPTMGEKSIFGIPKLVNSDAGDFYKVAKQKMSEIIKPDPKRLKDLASERAQAIAKYIVQKGGVPNERVFILDSTLDPKREGKEIVSALSLKTS